MLTAFLHGFILSLGLILAIGPQNLFLINQGTAHHSLWRAAPVIVAAALSDTLLILLAVLGVSAVVLTLEWVRLILLGAGVIFLLVIGWLTWRDADRPPDDDLSDSGRWPLGRQITFTLSISLLNPQAILDTVGVIGASSLSYQGSALAAYALGCILNSWLFFTLLVVAGRLLAHAPALRQALNRASAVIMWGSAIYLASTLI
ncbi:MAG: LysE family transporter [Chloroflexi bacterium]|nr:LysE family transporter [Chloroflexota bacterium]